MMMTIIQNQTCDSESVPLKVKQYSVCMKGKGKGIVLFALGALTSMV